MPLPAPLLPHDYSGTCWWCGTSADSREHRHKASDLRREFASAEYADGDVVGLRAGQQVTLRGPNARLAKFPAMFCARCNNQRSQPFDLAYDRFIEWYLANESGVEQSGRLPLDEIYDDWEAGTADLLRYFTKHVGCRIAESGYTVPDPLIDFLDGAGEPSGLLLAFEINGIFSAINAIVRDNPTEHGTSGNLGFGPVTGEVTRQDRHATVLRSWWVYHGLRLAWEWSVERPTSWTNLIEPVVELPKVDQAGGRGMLRVSQGGIQGLAWRRWYQARRAVGLGPKL